MCLAQLALCCNGQKSQVQTSPCRSSTYLHFRRAYGTSDGFSSGPIIPQNSMATRSKDMAICHHAWQGNHSRLDRHSLRSSRAVGSSVNEEGSPSFFSFLCTSAGARLILGVSFVRLWESYNFTARWCALATYGRDEPWDGREVPFQHVEWEYGAFQRSVFWMR